MLCIGGFGAVVAGSGPGDALYGLRTMLFGEQTATRDDAVILAAQTEMQQVQQLIDQGDWQGAQERLETITTTVATVNDVERKQELVTQWQELTVKVEAQDAAATVEPGAPLPTFPDVPVVSLDPGTLTPLTPGSSETTTSSPAVTSSETTSPTSVTTSESPSTDALYDARADVDHVDHVRRRRPPRRHRSPSTTTTRSPVPTTTTSTSAAARVSTSAPSSAAAAPSPTPSPVADADADSDTDSASPTPIPTPTPLPSPPPTPTPLALADSDPEAVTDTRRAAADHHDDMPVEAPDTFEQPR